MRKEEKANHLTTQWNKTWASCSHHQIQYHNNCWFVFSCICVSVKLENAIASIASNLSYVNGSACLYYAVDDDDWMDRKHAMDALHCIWRDRKWWVKKNIHQLFYTLKSFKVSVQWHFRFTLLLLQKQTTLFETVTDMESVHLEWKDVLMT